MRDREHVGREVSPSVTILDSHCPKTTAADAPHGYGTGENVLSRTRRALVNSGGRVLKLDIGSDGIQDRGGAVPSLKGSRWRFPFIECAFAESVYAGDRVAEATRIIVEIVR